jgi:lipopolysaccharide/colanic/teichoic acid biosynthesis glycosyltransferase
MNPGKRAFDVCIASLLAIVMALPMLVIACIIRCTSAGKAIILQKRVGLHGKEFTLWKFRTMRKEVGLYEMAPSHLSDMRITPIGRFLRRTSLDELPQLWNVLRGDMSLVGPRPEMPFIVETYDSTQRRRLDVVPGLTGLWQIKGRKDVPLLHNIHLDLEYIEKQNLALDILILIRTIPVVIFGRGAY